MAHRKVNSPEDLKKGDILFWDTPKKLHEYDFSLIFLHLLFIHDVKASENIKFQFPGAI